MAAPTRWGGVVVGLTRNLHVPWLLFAQIAVYMVGGIFSMKIAGQARNDGCRLAAVGAMTGAA